MQTLEYANGKAFVVTEVPSATAFNVVFAIGIALSNVCIALSLAARNNEFKKGNSGKTTDNSPFKTALN